MSSSQLQFILALALFACLAVQQWQTVSGFDFVEEAGFYEQDLPCDDARRLDRIGPECRLLELYNRTEIESLEPLELANRTERCACQLSALPWRETFDNDGPEIRRVAAMVEHNINRTISGSGGDNGDNKHPDYLWSNIEVIAYRFSIYTAANDYFDQQARNKTMVPAIWLRRRLEKDPIWNAIRVVCRKVARDPKKLYRYMENLSRASPSVFFRLIYHNELVNLVYQASKACKLLLMLKFRNYKLKPDSNEFVAVDQSAFAPAGNNDSLATMLQRQSALDSENSVSTDIDLMLRDASALLLRCDDWQAEKNSLQQLTRDCPMMMGDQVPTEWIIKHRSSLDRSMMAIKCGCQLLLHNSTWSQIMLDPNVQIMTKSLTNFLNHNRLPDFATTPIWSLYGWFENLMLRFTQNRKMTVKEIVKTRSGQQDPVTVTADTANSEALELLRRGCNYIMFNYRKGSKDAGELKLIKYLDNLQLISQDPMFVFHLTLQDPNLFKLHALSKMCEPVVR